MTTMRKTLNFRETGVISSRAFIALVALIVLAATGFTANTAEAANRFAVVGMENTTHVTIRMQHKWGDGAWTTDVTSRRFS